MAITLLRGIRPMRGGSQSHLMLGSDGNLYVVKWQQTPQGIFTLANELIVSRLAKAANLSVPDSAIVKATSTLTQQYVGLLFDHGRGRREPGLAGLQFGSKFLGTDIPGEIVDHLAEPQLKDCMNLREFAGILALDKWTGNLDRRQAIFRRNRKANRYQAFFIDHGLCFNAGKWDFPDLTNEGLHDKTLVYHAIKGWENLSPWIEFFEEITPDLLWSIAKTVPSEWYENNTAALERLVEALLKRRSTIRALITAVRNSNRATFPNWTSSSMSVQDSRSHFLHYEPTTAVKHSL